MSSSWRVLGEAVRCIATRGVELASGDSSPSGISGPGSWERRGRGDRIFRGKGSARFLDRCQGGWGKRRGLAHRRLYRRIGPRSLRRESIQFVTKSSGFSPSSHTCCLGILFDSASVSLPSLSSGHAPFKTEITFPQLLVNVLLVYRLTPKFVSYSCKGKSELSPPTSTHSFLTMTRHFAATPPRPNLRHRITLPPYSPIYFFTIPPSPPSFSLLRPVHQHLSSQ